MRLSAVLLLLVGITLNVHAQAINKDGPRLSCTLDIPTITADNATLKYVPMPFQVTLTALNNGGIKTDSVWATIILQPDLALADGDAPDKNTKLMTPSILLPNGKGTVSWNVKHPITMVRKTYDVRIWVWSSNADSSVCDFTVVIPPFDAPILQPRDYCPDSLHFDNAADSYIPNPFMLRLTCVNTGSTAAANVSGQIILPPDLILDTINHPGQTLLQFFTPSTIQVYKPGDPVPELKWWVYYTKRFRRDVKEEFHYKVGGLGITGIPTDTAEIFDYVAIPGIQPHLSCTLTAPDSLGLNALGNGNAPNPFKITYTVRNDSKQVAYIRSIALNDLTADGIRPDVSDTMKDASGAHVWGRFWRPPYMTLQKGESRTFEWTLFALPRLSQRMVPIHVVAFDDEGNEVMQNDDWTLCSNVFPIAPIPVSLYSGGLASSAAVLRYNPAIKAYEPGSFVLSCTLINSGGANLDNVTTKLCIQDTLGMLEFDPAYPDNSNPRTWPLLFPGTNQTFTWGFRLARKNITGVLQTVNFAIAYGSDETPPFDCWTGPVASIDVEPATGVSVTPLSPAPYNLSQNKPNPFTQKTVIDYELAQETDFSLTVYDLPGREILTLAKGRANAGKYSVAFDAKNLPSGVYIYKLETPTFTKVMRMILER